MARSRPQKGHYVNISGKGNYTITRVFWDEGEQICVMENMFPPDEIEPERYRRISSDIMERTRKFWPEGGWLVDGDYV